MDVGGEVNVGAVGFNVVEGVVLCAAAGVDTVKFHCVVLGRTVVVDGRVLGLTGVTLISDV